MKRLPMSALLVVMLLTFVSPVFAGDFGTADEAKAMLDRAVAALKADKAEALAKFSKGEGGFKDRDLYPYCGGPDGNFTAHPTLVGKSFGQEIYAVAKEETVSEVSYMWPRPGSTDLVQKIALITKAGDQVCAVGYYK